MTLALLLILAAPTAVGFQAGLAAADAVQGGRPVRSFHVAPLQLGRAPVRSFALRLPAPAPPERSSVHSTETQLTNGRTGMTCTMRILVPARATDPGIVRPIPEGRGHDPIVRNDLSPCVE
jgi:hypothetical protein